MGKFKTDEVYIVGVSRTGSKFYLQLLNSIDGIYIAPELVVLHPLKKCLYDILKHDIKVGDINELVRKVENVNIKDTLVDTIRELNKTELRKILQGFDKLTIYKILFSILKSHSLGAKSDIVGAKFPVHYMYTRGLLNDRTNSSILFLLRDPREIYISDKRKKHVEKIQGRNTTFPVKGFLLKYFVALYTLVEWYFSVKYFEFLCGQKRYHSRVRLYRYENILESPDKVYEDVFEFIGFDKNDWSRKNIAVLDSSFNMMPEIGRWRYNMNVSEKVIFRLFLGRKMKKYGYNWD